MGAPANLVHQLSTTTGIGNFTLTTTGDGKQTFAAAFGTGTTPDIFDYFIFHQSQAEWEEGTGHIDSTTGALVRDTVKQSSNSNSAVNFSAGTKNVTNAVPAQNIVRNEGSTVTDGDIAVFDQTTGRKLKTSSTSMATVKSYTGTVSLLNPPPGYTAAVGDGVTYDTAAIQALLNNFKRVYAPGGKTYLCKNITIPSGVELFGDGDASIFKFSDTSNLPNGALFSIGSNTKALLRDFQIQMDPAVYTNGIGIFLSSATDCVVRNVSYDGAGAYGVYANPATRCIFDGLKALTTTGGKQLVLLQNGVDCTIKNCVVVDGSVLNGSIIETTGSNQTVIEGNRINKTHDSMFGIHTFQGLNEIIRGNIITNSRREAIAFNGKNELCSQNLLYWADASGGGDFGISCEGTSGNLTQDCIIAENIIIGSALPGIGIPGYTERLLVIGNKIVDSGVQNAGNPWDCAIRLYGTSCADHVITGNDFVKISSAGMTYGVREDSGINTNRIINNRLYGLTGNVLFSDSGDTGTGPGVFANSPVFGGNARFKHNSGVGAGFWFDSPSASQRIFFGQDAVTADFFRIYGVAFANNVLGVNTATADMSSLGSVIVKAPSYNTAPTSTLDVRGNIASATPVTKTGTSGSVGATDGSLIINASGTFTLTLPTASTCPGRWLHIKTIAAQAVNSASSNVVPLTSATAATAILAATAGKWIDLQSDGTNWVAMAGN